MIWLNWSLNPREWDCERVRDRWVWESRVIERAEQRQWARARRQWDENDGSEWGIWEWKNERKRVWVRSFSQVQNGVVWTLLFFFFFLTHNPVPAEISIPAEIGRNWSEQSKRAETPRNLARGGTRGFPVPVCIPARKIPSVSAGMERY